MIQQRKYDRWSYRQNLNGAYCRSSIDGSIKDQHEDEVRWIRNTQGPSVTNQHPIWPDLKITSDPALQSTQATEVTKYQERIIEAWQMALLNNDSTRKAFEKSKHQNTIHQHSVFMAQLNSCSSPNPQAGFDNSTKVLSFTQSSILPSQLSSQRPIGMKMHQDIYYKLWHIIFSTPNHHHSAYLQPT